jgi:Recombination endonuclease VII
MKMYAELTRKTCSKCKKLKLYQEFQKDSRAASGLSSKCKECIKEKRQKRKEHDKAYWKKYANKNVEKLKQRDRKYSLKRKFNMTIEEYNTLLKTQNNQCAIVGCKKQRSSNGKRLAVDHCHKTGKIRGLLCNECNTSLGLLRENTEIILGLIHYLNSKKLEIKNSNDNRPDEPTRPVS